MDAVAVLKETFDRVPSLARTAADGLTADQLAYRPDPAANSVAWLVWHAAREQDHQIADAAGTEQAWMSGGWVQRFDLSLPAEDMGYGHSSDDVAKVRVDDPALLFGYVDAVHEEADRYLDGLSERDLDEVIDANWNPPVTLGVRLVSVVDDAVQHLGQAAYLRGIIDRRS
jgi:hypothetical protein